jgi:hypothetical protein
VEGHQEINTKFFSLLSFLELALLESDPFTAFIIPSLSLVLSFVLTHGSQT